MGFRLGSRLGSRQGSGQGQGRVLRSRRACRPVLSRSVPTAYSCGTRMACSTADTLVASAWQAAPGWPWLVYGWYGKHPRVARGASRSLKGPHAWQRPHATSFSRPRAPLGHSDELAGWLHAGRVEARRLPLLPPSLPAGRVPADAATSSERAARSSEALRAVSSAKRW